MILAAGLGTRLKPFTDKHPKALAVVNGKTLLQRNIEYLLTFDIKDIIVNIHHFPDQIREYVRSHNGFGAHITFSDETDKVLETGGGLIHASWFLKDSNPFLMMNVDILTDLDIHKMISLHTQRKALATLAVSRRKTSRYFMFDEEDRLCGWKSIKMGEQKIRREAQKYFDKAFSGISILSPGIFDLNIREGKFSIVDTYLDLAADHPLFGYDHTGCKMIDAGKPEKIKEAEEIFA